MQIAGFGRNPEEYAANVEEKARQLRAFQVLKECLHAGNSDIFHLSVLMTQQNFLQCNDSPAAEGIGSVIDGNLN